MTEERGGYIRYDSEELDFFPEGGDAWEALKISPDMQIVLDTDGFITDIWDSVTKKLYDGVGKEIGMREIAYELPLDVKKPKDMTDDELEEAMMWGVRELSKEMRASDTMRDALNDKYKGFSKFKREKNKRERAEKQGYNPRYRMYRRYPIYTGTYRRTADFTTGFFAT